MWLILLVDESPVWLHHKINEKSVLKNILKYLFIYLFTFIFNFKKYLKKNPTAWNRAGDF